MNHEIEFKEKTIEEVQEDFFMGELEYGSENIPAGVYYYRVSGLNSELGDLVLFQMDNQIIASAVFEASKPKKRIIDGIQYNGEFWFDQDTINIFKPISSEELQNYIPEFSRFGDTKYDFELADEYYEKLLERLNRKK